MALVIRATLPERTLPLYLVGGGYSTFIGEALRLGSLTAASSNLEVAKRRWKASPRPEWAVVDPDTGEVQVCEIEKEA